jgi:uncharacterized membrane protein
MDLRLPAGRNLTSWLLVASIGANLFLAGWIAGHSRLSWNEPPGPGPFVEGILGALSDQGSQVMTQAFDDMRSVFDNNRSTFKASRDQLVSILNADRFSKIAFLEEKKGERADRAKMETAADRIFADSVSRLSLEDRRKLARMRIPPIFGPPPPSR